MRIESQASAFRARVRDAFWRSTNDALTDARRRIRSRSGNLAASGQVERIGPTHGRLIFDEVYATAHERGAFIRPRRKKALRIEGRPKARARLRPHPYIEPAGRAWPRHLERRLREA